MKTIQPESLIGQVITCHVTGKQFTGAIEGCSTNYARDSQGHIFSNEGVEISQKKDLLDRSKPFTGYISGDGRSLAGWKGNVLGTVIWSSPVRLTRRSFWHGKDYAAFRIRDIHGGLWYGRGSPGICINVRAMKG